MDDAERSRRVLGAAREARSAVAFGDALGLVTESLTRVLPADKVLGYVVDLATYRRVAPGYRTVTDADAAVPPASRRVQVAYPLAEMMPYGRYYMRFDPLQEALHRRPGRPVRMSALYPDGGWGRDPFTADYCSQVGTRYCLAVGQLLPGGLLLFYGLFRGPRRRDFSRADVETLSGLTPVLVDATRRALAAEALHGVPPSAGDADVLAVVLDREGDPLAHTPGRVAEWQRLVERGALERLRPVVRAMTPREDPRPRERTLVLDTDDGWVEARLLREAGADRVTLLVTRLQPGTVGFMELQARSAGLTEAQAEVAALALQGYPNREIAARRGTSAETVKRQLQAAYGRFGISGRAELGVALLGRGSGSTS